MKVEPCYPNMVIFFNTLSKYHFYLLSVCFMNLFFPNMYILISELNFCSIFFILIQYYILAHCSLPIARSTSSIEIPNSFSFLTISGSSSSMNCFFCSSRIIALAFSPTLNPMPRLLMMISLLCSNSYERITVFGLTPTSIAISRTDIIFSPTLYLPFNIISHIWK